MKADLRYLRLIESVRAHPRGAQLLLDDAPARDLALRGGQAATQAMRTWIEQLAAAPAMLAAQRQAGRLLLLILGLLALLAVTGGVAAAGAALGRSPVNILWALAALIGMPLLMLLLWMLTLLPGGSSVLRGPWQALLRLPLRGQGRPVGADRNRTADAALRSAARRGLWRLIGEGRSGYWLMASVSHGLWLLFALAALVVCALRLAFIQFEFEWATTILSETTARQLLVWLGAAPAALGLTVPDAALLEASRAGGEGAGREIWGRFLLACLFVYGLLPRLLLLVLSLTMVARAIARRSPNLADPVFLPAMLLLRREAQAEGPAGPPPAVESTRVAQVEDASRDSGDYLALVGVELDGGLPWPPQPDDALDLGHVGGRAERRRVLDDLRELPARPRAVLAVCSLARSPDRAAIDLLAALQAAAAAPLLLALTEADVAAAAGIDLDSREQDWREAGRRAGVAGCRVLTLAELRGLRGADWRQWLTMALAS